MHAFQRGQIESGFHASSVRTVSEPSPTSLPTLLTRPMLHHRRQSHRPTLCRPRWRHPHSHLRLASPTRAQRLILMYCQGTRFCSLGGPPVVAVRPSPPPAPRDVKLLCVSPQHWTVARDYPPPPRVLRPAQTIFIIIYSFAPHPPTAAGFDQGASMPLPPPSHHPCYSAPMTVHCP